MRVVAALLGLAACHSADNADVSPDFARTCIDDLVTLAQAVAAMDGMGAVSGVQHLGGFVSRHDSTKPTLGMTVYEADPTSGTAVCDPTGCTFTDVMSSNMVTFWVLNGTISRTGTTLTFELTKRDGGKVPTSDNWTIDGSITVSDAEIDGSVHRHDEVWSQSVTVVAWDFLLEPTHVALDPSGCPIGGSIDEVVRYDDPANGVPTNTSPSFDIQGRVGFGPNCGDAR